MKKYWNMVMDERHNPLRALPPPVAFQIMTILAMMWSFVFVAMLGWWMWFPHYILGHMVLLTVGAVITNYTFENTHKLTHRDLFRSQDKTYALYDDYWGS